MPKKYPNFNIILNDDYTTVNRDREYLKQYTMKWGKGFASKKFFSHPQFRLVNKNENKILKYETSTIEPGYFPWSEDETIKSTCYHNLTMQAKGKPLNSIFECYQNT
jgi:hypothetical protein